MIAHALQPPAAGRWTTHAASTTSRRPRAASGSATHLGPLARQPATWPEQLLQQICGCSACCLHISLRAEVAIWPRTPCNAPLLPPATCDASCAFTPQRLPSALAIVHASTSSLTSFQTAAETTWPEKTRCASSFSLLARSLLLRGPSPFETLLCGLYSLTLNLSTPLLRRARYRPEITLVHAGDGDGDLAASRHAFALNQIRDGAVVWNQRFTFQASQSLSVYPLGSDVGSEASMDLLAALERELSERADAGRHWP